MHTSNNLALHKSINRFLDATGSSLLSWNQHILWCHHLFLTITIGATQSLLSTGFNAPSLTCCQISCFICSFRVRPVLTNIGLGFRVSVQYLPEPVFLSRGLALPVLPSAIHRSTWQHALYELGGHSTYQNETTWAANHDLAMGDNCSHSPQWQN